MNEKGLNTFNRKPAANFFKELSVKKHLFQKKKKKKLLNLDILLSKFHIARRKNLRLTKSYQGLILL